MQAIDLLRVSMPSTAIYRVAFDVPLRRLFDYLPPEDEAGLAPGSRVEAPFGRTRAIGIVVEGARESDIPAGRLKRLRRAADGEPVFDEALFALLRWCADYYHHPLGEVLMSALPKALRSVRRKP